MFILSGDIGATNVRIAIIETVADTMRICSEHSFISSDFDTPQDVVAHAIAITGTRPKIVALGVAGPVRNQCSEATNLPWHIDSLVLKRAFSLSNLFLLNDLEAIAWGIPVLADEDYFDLYSGNPDPNGNLAIIAAGTGLGVAGVCRNNGGFYPFSSEGGHTDFAPSCQALELELLQFLSNRYGRVSWERAVSGQGIPDLLDFLYQHYRHTMPTDLKDRLLTRGGAALIAAAAETGECSLCEATMDLFVRLYGRVAGNHALSVMATGGVYLAGGIAPKILLRLQTSGFLANFFNKGRMQLLMRDMPIRVILNHRAALYGAARATIHNL